MATRPKAVIESRNGEEFSPITIAKNVLTDDGQNLHDILSDRKEDMMTPTIENSSSIFKVGQGDNVDYSSNVVNGAYESTVLKGKTMVNCIQESSSQDVVLPYEFEEGQYVTINDTKESGALGVELKGQTLVNATGEPIVNLVINSSSPKYLNKNILKKDTVYTFIYDIEEVTGGASGSWGRFNYTDGTYKNVLDKQYTTGITKVATSFNKDLNNLYICWIRSHVEGQSVKLRSLMILEGDWTNKELPPYFTGMTSCKMPILHTVGKNLFDGELEKGYIDGSGGYKASSTAVRSINYIGVKPNTNYIISSESYTGAIYIHEYDANHNHINQIALKSFTTSSNARYIKFNTNNNINTDLTAKFQIEQNTQSTTYEAYKSSILSLPEEVVLGGLGNTRDTFNTTTGNYTKRTDTKTVTNYKNSLGSSVVEGAWSIVVAPPNKKWQSTTLCVSDKFSMGGGHSNRDCGFYENPANFVFFDKTVNSADEFIAKYGDFSFTYILETPVVTKINLPSTLKSWNTTTHIYSEIPENTLYPTLTHSNPTYPVILKPSTKYSIVTNSYSNDHTNSAINFNLGGATASTIVGNRVTAITTPSTLSNELLTMSGRGNKLNNVMVIEGDVVGDEPYFKGMCDSKSPILSNCGKNLFNTPYFDNMDNLLNNTDAYVTYKVKTIKLKPNTVYTFSHEGGELKSNIWSVFNIEATSENKIITTIYNIKNWSNTTHQKISPLQRTFKSPSDGVIHLSCYSRYKASGEVYDHFTEDGMFTRVLKNIQLEETSTSTQYEPYKSNTITFNQKDDKTIVLRSLPNGVCDTLNVETGEYVQRIGEYRVTGGKEETYSTDGQAQYIYISNTYALMGMKSASVLVCDKFPYHEKYFEYDYSKVSSTGVLIFVLPTSATGLSTKEEREAYIRNLAKTEGITIQYELVTPIVSTIDVQGFPYAYTNGHVQLSSGSIEQSLTPKVEYSVVTNRNGQIRSNQKMVERHQKQLDRLQAMILTNLVNTQYEQTLTNLKYDLKNVREEVK